MIPRAQCRCTLSLAVPKQAPLARREACGTLGKFAKAPAGRRERIVRRPAQASLSTLAIASAQMRNPHYTVAEMLDSPLSYLALMSVPIGLYFMFKILLWDYRSRRTDDPDNPDRAQSFSLTSRPGPGQMPQSELPAVATPRHLVRDPELQAMAAAAAIKVASAVRQAKSTYEGELKLRSMNNDHVGAMEWDWVWSMLQSKDGKTNPAANAELLEKAQQQVKQGRPASSTAAVSTMLAEMVAEQQALQQVQQICNSVTRL